MSNITSITHSNRSQNAVPIQPYQAYSAYLNIHHPSSRNDIRGGGRAADPAKDISPAVTKKLTGLAGGKHSGILPAAPLRIASPTPASRAESIIRTGLSAEVDKIAGKSPSLQQKLKQLQNDGWQIQYGQAGTGSKCDRPTKTITIDIAKRGAPATVAQLVAHEAGHATYAQRFDFTSKNAYVRSALADEGAATLSNVQARREILASGGPDIGIAGNWANAARYNAAYDQFLKDGDVAKARDTIGAIYGQGERTSVNGQIYADYYGDWYDRRFGKQA